MKIKRLFSRDAKKGTTEGVEIYQDKVDEKLYFKNRKNKAVSLSGYSKNVDLCDITLTPISATLSQDVNFSYSKFDSTVDVIDADVFELTNVLGVFKNLPTDTEVEFNNQSTDPVNFGFNDLSNIEDRTYSSGFLPNPTPGDEVVIREPISNTYIAVVFSAFYNSKGVITYTYDRQLISLSDPCEITFSDGTKMSTAVIIPEDTKIKNTVYVDGTYGDNATGEREVQNKPFLTIKLAIAAASAGDHIVVRAGVYKEIIILKDGVDITMEGEVTINGVSDNGVPVRSKVIGTGKFQLFGNDSVELSADSNVFIKAYSMFASGVIITTPKTTASPILTIECETIQCSANYAIRAQGSPNITVNVREISGTGNTYLVVCRDSFSGTVTINAETYIATTRLLSVENTSIGGIVNLKGGVANVTGTFAYVVGDLDELNIDIKKISTPSLIGVAGGTPSGEFTFTGCDITLSSATSVFITTVSSVIDLKMTDCDIDITLSSATTHRIFGIYGVNTLTLEDTTVKADMVLGDGDIILKGSTTSKVILKDAELIASNIVGTAYAINGVTLADGDVYIKNTRSNLDKSATVTDLATPTGFIGNDTGLTYL